MIANKIVLRSVFALSLAASLTCSAGPALLLDFGPTTVAYAEAMLDMGHFAGAVPNTQISWNQIVNADNNSLSFADGSAAAGVSIVVGRSPTGVTNVIDYTNKLISSSVLGGAENWGIYTNTSPIKDGIFATGTSAIATNALGIRVDGLSAGTYTLYISGRNTSTGFSSAQRFFATNGAIANTFAFETNTTPFATEANSGTTSGNPTQADAVTSSFAYGDNCTHLVVTLNSGDSLFLAAVGVDTSSGFRGFLNAVEIVPGSPILTNFPAVIGTQPSGATVYEGATVSISNVKYGGMPPLTYQWYHNATPITGATNTTLTLANVIPSDGGNYRVSVANIVATNSSSNAVITVVPFFNTAQMTNIWNILPGDTNHPYITTTAGGERGLVYNPATSNLLVLTHIPTNNLFVLDPATGNQKYFMNLSGILTTAGGINMVGVADDGTVYAGNVTANAQATPYNLWQWVNDGSNTAPLELIAADPGGSTGLRWGDNLAVRGAGTTTQILIAPGKEANGYGTNVVIYTTSDPNVQIFAPIVIGVSGVPSGFGQGGVAFGPGTNTFWAKNKGGQLYLIQFDLSAQKGAVQYAFGSSNNIPDNFQFIGASSSQRWLAGVMSVASGLPDNVRLYNISNLTNGPVLADQETNLTTIANGFNNGVGVGSTTFGGNYLFALDSQNGVRAFVISTNIVLAPFSITSITAQAGPATVLSWQSVAGHTYQVQIKTNLLDAAWSNVGLPIAATSAVTSATNNMSPATRFYRVQGN